MLRLLSSFGLSLLPSGLRACDLALLLALDISGSVDSNEYRIQRDGLALALKDGLVAQALLSANAQVAVMQWTGSTRQRITIEWTQINSFADAERLAGEVAVDPRVWRTFSTAIGEAMQAGLQAFEQVDCTRKIMDISSDGQSNEGPAPERIKDQMRAEGVVVNALVIEGADDDLTGYFWENVITGPGAFVVTANRFEAYPERIREKLIREIVPQFSRISPPEWRETSNVITR